MSVQVCLVSLIILYGERRRGSGGGTNDGAGLVSRAVERQRRQLLCALRGCRSSCFQQLDCRSVGAVEVMTGDESMMRINEERSSPPTLTMIFEKRASVIKKCSGNL